MNEEDGLMDFGLYVDILDEITNEDIRFESHTLTLTEIESVLYTWKYGMRGD